MNTLETMTGYGHEEVAFHRDRDTGLRAIVAIHDTRLGPGLGGIRIREYDSEDAALTDVLRLSRAMTYKNACAGLDFGGAKSVLLAPLPEDRRAAFLAMGRIVEGLAGRYVATEDMGMTEPDVAVLNEVTPHAVGRSRRAGGSGDPSPHTAKGVYVGMRAALHAAGLGGEFAGRKVAVQGCGKVGRALIRHLIAVGADVAAADTDEAAAEAAGGIGATIVAPDEILFRQVDVLAPCAAGGILNAETIPELRCKTVAGGANNQLAEDEDAERLAEYGVVYAPDFVINAGGVINVGDELAEGGYHPERVAYRIAAIERTLDEIFAEAAETGRTPHETAIELAERRLAG